MQRLQPVPLFGSRHARLTPSSALLPPPRSVLCLACTRLLRARATPAAPALCPVFRMEVESFIVREFVA